MSDTFQNRKKTVTRKSLIGKMVKVIHLWDQGQTFTNYGTITEINEVTFYLKTDTALWSIPWSDIKRMVVLKHG